MRAIDYNPEGKKLTYKQHMKRLQDMEEKEASRNKQTEDGHTPGRCPKCNGSNFSLKIENHKLIRTCSNVSCQSMAIF